MIQRTGTIRCTLRETERLRDGICDLDVHHEYEALISALDEHLSWLDDLPDQNLDVSMLDENAWYDLENDCHRATEILARFEDK